MHNKIELKVKICSIELYFFCVFMFLVDKRAPNRYTK